MHAALYRAGIRISKEIKTACTFNDTNWFVFTHNSSLPPLYAFSVFWCLLVLHSNQSETTMTMNMPASAVCG
ncbi:MAG: hypothetical protein ACJA13_001398 [Paraglaciecola sp.]|jgi:hypothetical protein